MAGIPLVAGDDRDARARMPFEPLAAGLLVVIRRRQRDPEASLARRLERRRADVGGVGVRRSLELGHGLDDEVLTVRDSRERGGRDGRARAFHLVAGGVGELVLPGGGFAHRGESGAPILIAQLEPGLGERALGLSVELLPPGTRGGRGGVPPPRIRCPRAPRRAVRRESRRARREARARAGTRNTRRA